MAMTRRWDLGKFNKVKGVPWEPTPGREGIEIRARVHVPRDNSAPEAPMEGEAKEVVPRRVRITREQVRMAGFTVGCPGCRAINRGQPAVNHTEQCRKRFEDNMRETGDEKAKES